MLNKIKKTRSIFAVLSALVLIIALALTALSLYMALRESYTPLWFMVPVSVVCYYAALILGFFSVDRSSAALLVSAAHKLGDISDTEALAREMGWKLKPTEKLLKKCKKWGYIE